jgi:sec-independent protein translocase protein TatA
MGMPSGIELFVIIAIIVLLFGGKKIPELAKGLGKGIKDFKSAIKEDENQEQQSAVVNNKKVEENKATETTSATTETKTTTV